LALGEEQRALVPLGEVGQALPVQARAQVGVGPALRVRLPGEGAGQQRLRGEAEAGPRLGRRRRAARWD